MCDEARTRCGDLIDEAAEILKRPSSYRDCSGYQTDLLGAAIHPQGNRVAYVQSRMKKNAGGQRCGACPLRSICGQRQEPTEASTSRAITRSSGAT